MYRTTEGNGFMWDDVHKGMMRAGQAFRRACRWCGSEMFAYGGVLVCPHCDGTTTDLYVPQ